MNLENKNHNVLLRNFKQKFQTKFFQKHFFYYTNNKTIKLISANPYQLICLATNFNNIF